MKKKIVIGSGIILALALLLVIFISLLQRKTIQNINQAIEENDTERLETLIDKAHDLDMRPYLISLDRVNNPPLFTACTKGNLEAIQMLLNAGADINSTNVWDDKTPLMCCLAYAPKETRFKIAYYLIDQGADYSYTHGAGYSVLSYTFRNVGSGDERDDEEVTAQLDFIKYLANKGLDLQTCDAGNSLIFDAAYANNVAILEYLINECGCDVNEIMMPEQQSPLIFAARANAQEAVAYLLAQGADPSICSSEGKTAYDYAIERGFMGAERLKP